MRNASKPTRILLSAGICTLASGCLGGLPGPPPPIVAPQNLGHDWREHFQYGLQLIEEDGLFNNRSVFARAAFMSAARFSHDHPPSYIGLGLTEMDLGNFAAAQIAFLNAALIEDRSMYWALSAMAALRNGDEVVARTLFDSMQMARAQDNDPASQFIRAVYLPTDRTFTAPIVKVPVKFDVEGVSDDLVCDEDSEDDACRNLNIVANVYFVRRYSVDTLTRGSDFFSELTFQLGAERTQEWEKDSGSWEVRILKELAISIPEIQYAVRLTPQSANSVVQVNAAPSVVASIGQESEIHEGSDKTILYNSAGEAEEYTAETGMTLHLEPELATPQYVSLKLDFEFSSMATLEPSATAHVLDVSKNTYTITGFFPYGRPVVLGTISSGTKEYNASGQTKLDHLPIVGGAFGKSEDQVSMSDTLVLGVLSEPVSFHGSHERRVLDAMKAMGVPVRVHETVNRRRILHRAPDVSGFGTEFLRTYVGTPNE